MRALALIPIVLATACGPEPSTPPPPPAEPADVTAAIDLCFTTLHGQVDQRADAIDALRAATDKYPTNARAFYFLGLCSLAALAEDGNLAALVTVEDALTKAMQLDPKNTRAAGFLWLSRLNKARFLKDQTSIDAAVQGLIDASNQDSFNSFPLALGLTPLPIDTGYPALAAQKLEARRAGCSASDETCVNSTEAPHRDSGYMMQMGDTYARLGDKTKAVDAYSVALAAAGVDTWPYAADAKTWAGAVDDRLMLYADSDPTNDPPGFLSGPKSCTGCHR